MYVENNQTAIDHFLLPCGPEVYLFTVVFSAGAYTYTIKNVNNAVAAVTVSGIPTAIRVQNAVMYDGRIVYWCGGNQYGAFDAVTGAVVIAAVDNANATYAINVMKNSENNTIDVYMFLNGSTKKGLYVKNGSNALTQVVANVEYIGRKTNYTGFLALPTA